MRLLAVFNNFLGKRFFFLGRDGLFVLVFLLWLIAQLNANRKMIRANLGQSFERHQTKFIGMKNVINWSAKEGYKGRMRVIQPSANPGVE